jgi:hypothetical protein
MRCCGVGFRVVCSHGLKDDVDARLTGISSPDHVRPPQKFPNILRAVCGMRGDL